MLVFWIIGGVLAAAAVGLGLYGRHQGRRARLIEETPTTPIGELTTGFAEVKGTVASGSGSLESPMSEKTCVYYAFEVEEKKTKTVYRDGEQRTKTYWATVIDDEDQVAFEVEDETGSIQVDLADAELNLETDVHASSGFLNEAPPELEETLRERYGRSSQGLLFNKNMRYQEVVLEEGDDLYVLGTAVTRGTRPRLTKGDGIYLVSDKGEADLLSSYRTRATVSIVAAIVLGLGALAVTGYGLLGHGSPGFERGPRDLPTEAGPTGPDAERELPTESP